MPFTPDFRAKQIQTTKIVASGSTGTGAKLLIYSEESENPSNKNMGDINAAQAFNTGSIGTDIFLYVSGTVSSGSSTDRVSVFGGSVVISGNLVVKGTISASQGAPTNVVTSSGGARYGVFPIFKTDDGRHIISSSYRQTSASFDSYLFGSASVNTPFIHNANEMITSGAVNVALGKDVAMVSGYKTGGPDNVFGFSVVGVTGSQAVVIARGNSNVSINETATSYSASADIVMTADGVVTASALLEAKSGQTANTNLNSVGVVSASINLNAESDNKAILQVKAVSTGQSASVTLSASADSYARVIILAETSDVNTTSSIVVDADHVQVSSASRVAFNEDTFGNRLGRDTYFHVSGTIGGKDSPTGKVAVIGGDLYVSGNLFIEGTVTGIETSVDISATGSGVVLTDAMTSLHLSAANPMDLSSSVTAGGEVTYSFHTFNVLRDLRPHHYWNAENVVTGAGDLILTISDLGSLGYPFTQSNPYNQATRALDERGHYYIDTVGNGVMTSSTKHYTAPSASYWDFLTNGTQEYFFWAVLNKTGSITPHISVASYNFNMILTTSTGSNHPGIQFQYSKVQSNVPNIRVLESDWGMTYSTYQAGALNYGVYARYSMTTPLTKSLVLFALQMGFTTGSSAKGGFHQEGQHFFNGLPPRPLINGLKSVSSSLNEHVPHLFSPLLTSTVTGGNGFDGRFYEMGIVKGLVPQWKIDRLAQWVEEYYGSFD